MEREACSGIMVVLLLMSILTLTFNVQLVRAEPRTWTVDDDGPADFTRVQDALNAASDGDTIYVYSGKYYERLKVAKAVALIGENKSITIIEGVGTESVIFLTANNATIRDFTIQGGKYGIYVRGGSNNVLLNNIIENNVWGILQYYSSNSILRGNNLANNTYNIHVSAYRTLRGYMHNIDTSNNVDGRPIYYLVNQRALQIPSDAGYVAVVNSTRITVKDLTLTHSGDGVFLAFSNSCVVENVTVSESWAGIRLENSHENIVLNSKISDNTNGVLIGPTSGHNAFDNNNLTNNEANLWFWVGDQLEDFVQDIDTSNSVNGKPIFYLINRNGLTIDSLDIGYLAVINSTKVAVKNLALTNNGHGILFACTNSSSIENVTLSSNYYGIGLVMSNNNSVFDSMISGNYADGLSIGPYSSHNLIACNTISNNSEDGIRFWWNSSNNIIYRNNIINNTYRQANVDKSSLNTWDNGIEGNYWSDYTGSDADDDGIGDTPYVIDEGNQDMHPLMVPWPHTPTMTRALIRTIKLWNLNKGIENSLTSKLDGALRLLDMGKEKGAVPRFIAFINHVEALRVEKLTNDQADHLISEAQTAIDLIRG